MCETGERGSSSDQRARVEGSRHASMNWCQIELRAKHQKRGGKADVREAVSAETFR